MRLVDDKGNMRLIPINPPIQLLQVWGVNRQALLCKEEQIGEPVQLITLMVDAT